MAEEFVRIPDERVPVLLGKRGRTKARIEKLSKVQIRVDPEDICVFGEPENVLNAVQIVRAIGRGFSPVRALNLLKEGWQLQMISLKGETKATIERLSGRVIGRRGSTRERIEKYTGCLVSVYGNTISAIGPSGTIEQAMGAIEHLLAGRTHAFVYRRLEKGE